MLKSGYLLHLNETNQMSRTQDLYMLVVAVTSSMHNESSKSFNDEEFGRIFIGK